MKIIVGTKNQKKVDTVLSVFKSVLNIENVQIIKHNAASGVPEAPHNKETYDGALNRAIECSNLELADYYIGVESGLVERYGNMFEEAWAVIISGTNIRYVGYSSGLVLPNVVKDQMNKGVKHNEIMAHFDKLFNLPDDNRDTWSRYTGGALSRQVSLEESIRNALIQTVETEQNLYKYE